MYGMLGLCWPFGSSASERKVDSFTESGNLQCHGCCTFCIQLYADTKLLLNVIWLKFALENRRPIADSDSNFESSSLQPDTKILLKKMKLNEITYLP